MGKDFRKMQFSKEKGNNRIERGGGEKALKGNRHEKRL